MVRKIVGYDFDNAESIREFYENNKPHWTESFEECIASCAETPADG